MDEPRRKAPNKPPGKTPGKTPDKAPGKAPKKVYRQKFYKDWLQVKELKDWIMEILSYPTKVRCR